MVVTVQHDLKLFSSYRVASRANYFKSEERHINDFNAFSHDLANWKDDDSLRLRSCISTLSSSSNFNRFLSHMAVDVNVDARKNHFCYIFSIIRVCVFLFERFRSFRNFFVCFRKANQEEEDTDSWCNQRHDGPLKEGITFLPCSRNVDGVYDQLRNGFKYLFCGFAHNEEELKVGSGCSITNARHVEKECC